MRKLSDITDKNNSHLLQGGVGSKMKHESAERHVSGKAIYCDDHVNIPGLLHAAVGVSSEAHALIKSLDLSAVKKASGVVAVIGINDVPGITDIGPVFPGDELFCNDRVSFIGQPIFAVAAKSHFEALQAVKKVKIEYDSQPAQLSIEDALEQQQFVRPPLTMKKGDADSAIEAAENILKGRIEIGGQEHFYLEGQVSVAIPTEEGGMEIRSSTQHPSEVQKLVAEVLAIPLNRVLVDTRRMGGGFGGKETQAAPWAIMATLLAAKTGSPVKLRLGRRDDFCLTGKRHPFINDYMVGFDNSGKIQGVNIELNANCGISPDLSDAIVDRAMFHSDNAYYLNQARITGYRSQTNLVSNTAFRGFGGPQGMMTIETIMDDIARTLGQDPLDIRKLNLYQENGSHCTHYGQKVENCRLKELIEKLEQSSNYRQRRQQINSFNQQNSLLKKGLALTPVKFGIAFTVQHLNQAGALIHIYTDGSIHLNHGGTEMGQGLFTKVAQIVAEEFQVDLDRIAVSSTRTDKVPNTSPTAASSGTDLNGKAAQAAARTIKRRLQQYLAEKHQLEESEIVFADNHIQLGGEIQQSLTFTELVQMAYMDRISLSATGFYKTPKIYFDRDSASGRPFFYFATGAAVSEVLIDTLTGEYRLLQSDILHDVGDSINPALDKGQIEGGFIQGMGWLTTEELCWNDKGQLLSNNPATYKIPAISDIPATFNVELVDDNPNQEDSIFHSKAVGEPPFMLAISVWCAIRDAIASIVNYRLSPPLSAPATPEKVLQAINWIQHQQNGEES